MLLNSRNHPADDTRALVIDLDHGEIKEETDNSDESKDEDKRNKRQTVVRPDSSLCWAWLTARQGTPIFVARSVVAGHPLADEPVFVMYNLPQLSSGALSAYETHLRQRLNTFPQPTTNQSWVTISIPAHVDTSVKGLRELPWTHKLYHDAESVFWLLVWWAIHIRPTSPPSPKIDSKTYGYLTSVDLASGRDGRTMFLQDLRRGYSWLDPSYERLEPLFKQMATQLMGELHWAESEEMKDPEFLHEALQRLIFDFLMRNKEASFMTLEKDLEPREIGNQVRQHAYKQYTPSAKRSHSAMEEEPEPEGSKVRHLSSAGLVYTLTLEEPKRPRFE